ncbi:hypothetical protein ACFL6M_04610 [Candidatus Eisenbacteria bacterium]|uniref:DUF3575 domain-containing protein n=1 Tax=Eiseniibacteriota bacterium TaxID=2212470 RepID=A0ABV6YKM7_UNCEI
MKRLVVPATMVLSCFLFHAVSADAQVCYRGKPSPTCRTFMVTEVGLGLNVQESQWENKGWPLLEIGLMRNLGKRYAVGGTCYVVYDSKYEDFRGGLKLRARRWFNPDLSMNLSGGLLFMGGSYGETFPAFAGHLDVNYRDLVAPYVAVDVLRHEASPLDGANVHMGLRFGSYPGTGLTGIAVGVVVLALYSRTVAG